MAEPVESPVAEPVESPVAESVESPVNNPVADPVHYSPVDSPEEPGLPSEPFIPIIGMSRRTEEVPGAMYNLARNPYSWSEKAHMIFLEQPIRYWQRSAFPTPYLFSMLTRSYCYVCLPYPVNLPACSLSACFSFCLSGWLYGWLPLTLITILSPCWPSCLSEFLSICLTDFLLACPHICLLARLSTCMKSKYHVAHSYSHSQQHNLYNSTKHLD